MLHTLNISDEGVTRTIDFQGAILPDGRSIQGVLDENIKLKESISMLEKDVFEKSSLLVKLIPSRNFRNLVEIVMFILSFIGLITLFL